MGQAFITRRGGGGYSEGDVIATTNLQPVYSALDFTKTFVTNTYSPNTTTAWSNILDTFILSDGATVLQITTTAFNLFKISEPLTLVATATHNEYDSYNYKSDDNQKIAINEPLGQFYTLRNGYIHAYSLTTLTEQWSTQYANGGSYYESVCVDPTDHTPWYISKGELIHYNPTTGSATQTLTITHPDNAFNKSCIYNGVIYGGSISSDYLYYGSWNLSTGATVATGSAVYNIDSGDSYEWFLYQNHLFYAYYDDYEYHGQRLNIIASSTSTNSFDIKYPEYLSVDIEKKEYRYHPIGITSDGNLLLVLGLIRYDVGTDTHEYRDAADLGVGCGTLTKTMSFSGTSAATQVAARSIGSVWNYNYRVPIKGPNYPVIGSEGFCYYPYTKGSAITQVVNLPTGYKVLSED